MHTRPMVVSSTPPPRPISFQPQHSPTHPLAAAASAAARFPSNPSVIKGEAAAKGGVRASDTVVSIDGNPSPASYEELRDIIGTIGRPVVVGFYRSGSGGGAGAGVGGARGQEAGPFQRAQDAARRKMDELKGSPQPQVGKGFVWGVCCTRSLPWSLRVLR